MIGRYNTCGGLAERAKVKTQTPMASKGIIKQRAKLDPPPAETER